MTGSTNTTLDRTLRKRLETAIRNARVVAEEGAADALRRLGVVEDAAPTYLSDGDKVLRVRLRAHARTLGDGWDKDKKRLLGTKRLQEAVAYEAWHRMLFGRFLVERGLLVHPEIGVAVGRDELAELAQEEGLPDEWALVERLAAPALPAVFRPDDPVLAVALAPEFAKRLRGFVVALPEEVFAAEDSLGWTYQFWRATEKDAINKAGSKIGAAELPAVTQLFTEPYMVKFLLHNTLGAWWANKVLTANPHLARDALNEQALRDACALPSVGWEFLRFVRNDGGAGPWRPAAGSFPGWPERTAEITFLDPCCGSGHFLVEAFALLAALRRAEEGLSAEDAARAVLRDNLHGLEIDGRCVQIAAFNVALSAWRLAGGPVALPQLHIAWVGAQPPPRAEMAALANGDLVLRRALEALHDQFVNASLFGSLLEVGAQDLLDVDLRKRGEAALARLREIKQPEQAEGAVAARGLLHAVGLLVQRYVLQATNVPFLLRRKQDPDLGSYIVQRMPEAKADLATAVIQRMRRLATKGGALASVTPQSWLFLGAYKGLREDLLRDVSFSMLVRLGARAFETIGGEVVNAALIVMQNSVPTVETTFVEINANDASDAQDKAQRIAGTKVQILSQSSQRRNPDTRIGPTSEQSVKLLADYAASPNGMHGADSSRFRHMFWEHTVPDGRWAPFQLTVNDTCEFGGREHVFDWYDNGILHITNPSARIQGEAAWNKQGVTVSLMNDLLVTLYSGEKFDISCSPIIPFETSHLPSIWAFCSSPDFCASVRSIDTALKVTNATLVKVPFDLAHWQAVAAERYPNGLPEPYSDDPTQWLFHGHPAHAVSGTELHVALGRLAGYRWPAETDTAMRLAPLARERIAAAAALSDTDADGLLPLHATAQDRALADRLRDLLAAAYDKAWTNAQEQKLVRAADMLLDKKEAKDANLEAWLRDRAFRQHCALFHQRPFLWHVWDGAKGGFSVFAHYHRLDRAMLEKLTYTTLGDWTARMKAEGRTAEEEGALRLRQRLVAILDGDDPYDLMPPLISLR